MVLQLPYRLKMMPQTNGTTQQAADKTLVLH